LRAAATLSSPGEVIANRQLTLSSSGQRWTTQNREKGNEYIICSKREPIKERNEWDPDHNANIRDPTTPKITNIFTDGKTEILTLRCDVRAGLGRAEGTLVHIDVSGGRGIDNRISIREEDCTANKFNLVPPLNSNITYNPGKMSDSSLVAFEISDI